MPTFTRKTNRTRRVSFEPGTRFGGLQIETSGMPLGYYLEHADSITRADAVRLFFEHLIDWNWATEDGTPVAPTLAAAVAAGIDASDMLSLAEFWLSQVTGSFNPNARDDVIIVGDGGGAATEPLEIEPLEPLPPAEALEPVAVNGTGS